MINLLPLADQRQLRSKRVKRAASMFGFFMAAIIVFGFVMLLPSFIALRYLTRDFSYAREVEERSPSNRALEEQTRALTDFESRARDVLAHARKTTSFENMVQEVLRVAPIGIDFTTMRFEEGSLVVEGHYQHRSFFLAFIHALETNALVKSVSSPLSNLLKETDAPFLITLFL